MKKLLTVLLVLCFALAAFGKVQAATTVPGGPFASAINIQNIGTTAASVTVKYVTPAGATAFTSSHSIAVGDVLSIYVPGVGGLAAGEYSVVVSSSQPVAAISNFSDSNSGASYSGANAGSTVWFIPGVYDNYYSYSSEVYAQNVSGAPQDITLQVFAPGNATAVYTNTKTAVPNEASVNWGLNGLAQLNNNVPYSAKVSAAGDVVVIANTYGTGATAPQLYSFNGFPSGATSFFVPVAMKNYYGWNAAIAIQNVSATAASVSVVFSDPGATTKNYTIQPNSAQSIYVPSVAGLPNGIFSAKITSSQAVAVSVNESNSYNRAATFNGVPTATTTVYAPNVMKAYYKYSSSITCQNVGTVAATMTVTYAGQPGATETSGSIAPSANKVFYLPNNTNLPNSYSGSAQITSAQPIICVINSNMEFPPDNVQSKDMLYSYNGVNK